MKKVVIGLLIGLFAFGVYAQTPPDVLWFETYDIGNEDSFWSVNETSDGDFLTLGQIGTWPQLDFYLVKTNVNGDTLWTKTFGGDGPEQGRTLLPIPEGGYFMTGITYAGNGTANYYLIKIDDDGNTLWTQTYVSPRADYCIESSLTSDGGLIMAGHTMDMVTYEGDLRLVRTDADGDTLWTRQYGSELSEYFYGVTQNDDGDFLVVGYNSSGMPNWTWNGLVMKISADGDFLWTYEFGEEATDETFYTIVQSPDGNNIIVGSVEIGGDMNTNVVKMTNSGDILWAEVINGFETLDEFPQSVQLTNDGGFIICGHYFTSTFGEALIYAMKLDAEVNLSWTKVVSDGGSWDISYEIQQTSENKFIIAGQTDKNIALNDDAALILLDQETVSIENYNYHLPKNIVLHNAFPNPFNPSTTIAFSISTPDHVTLEVFNIKGEKVKTLVDGSLDANNHTITWNGNDNSGKSVASGVYFYKLKAGGIELTKKMILMK